jgi:HEAT repeat protein
MNRNKSVIYISGFSAIAFLLIFFISAKAIGISVKNQCAINQDMYSADCVEVLIKLIEDETIEYEEKNSAIWALGQLGDKRSLSLLQEYCTGYNSESKTKRNEALSQYELHKAIKLSKGGFNFTAFVWR